MPASSHGHDSELLVVHDLSLAPTASKLMRASVESLRSDMAGEKWFMAAADRVYLCSSPGTVGQMTVEGTSLR